MSSFSELLGCNVERWREHVETQFCTDQSVFAERLDELEYQANQRHWYMASGHEVEFRLASPSGVVPDRKEFYEAYLTRMCAPLRPLNAHKGALLDPRECRTPIFVSQGPGGDYLWQSQGPTIMETATAPSLSWRESNERYWNVLGTLGEVATSFGCRAQILGTHMHSSAAWMASKNVLITDDNFEGDGRMLLAMQKARTVLEPFEPYASLVSRWGETYSEKIALWALHRHTVETRFPVFGVVDSRLSMLGGLAGMNQVIERHPMREHAAVHPCLGFNMYDDSGSSAVEALSSIMLWDKVLGKMVLPGDITRSGMEAAATSYVTEALDDLITQLTDGAVTDFSADNAAALRTAVEGLVLDTSGSSSAIAVDVDSPYMMAWQPLLRGLRVRTRSAARIVRAYDMEESKGFVADRKKATASPEVAAILGEKLLAVLTPSTEAYRLRQLTLNTRRLPAAA